MSQTPKFRVKNTSGQYWTGSCWGVVQAAESYSMHDLGHLTMGEDCSPENFFGGWEDDIGWWDGNGEGIASVERV